MGEPRRSTIEWNAMNPNRRPLRRFAVAAAAVALPASAIFLGQTASYAGDEPGGPVFSTEGTICWEKGQTPTQRPVVTVYLNDVTKDPVSVVLDTADGTAIAPDDYAAIRGQVVTIPAGASRVEVPLTIRPDAVVEPNEWFSVTISKPSAGRIGKGTATVVIQDGSPPSAK
jgi:hypothetical protein